MPRLAAWARAPRTRLPGAEFGERGGSVATIDASVGGAIYLGVHKGLLRAWSSADGASWHELPAAQPVPETIRTGHVTDLVFVQALVVVDDTWVAMGQGSQDCVQDLWFGEINP